MKWQYPSPLNPMDSHLQCDHAMSKEGAMALRKDERTWTSFLARGFFHEDMCVYVCVCVLKEKLNTGDREIELSRRAWPRRAQPRPGPPQTRTKKLVFLLWPPHITWLPLPKTHCYLITFKCSFHRLSYTMYNKAIYNSTKTSPNAACRGHIIWGPNSWKEI